MAVSTAGAALVLVAAGTVQDPGCIPAAPVPPTAGALGGVSFLDEWEQPERLPAPVNLPGGWEDSAIISADGGSLYFAYSRWDPATFHASGQVVASGPPRPGHHGDSFDLYQARIVGDSWVVDNHPINTDAADAAIGIDALQSRLVFVRFSTAGGDIHLTERGSTWSTPQPLPSPVNTACVEDNPHLSADGSQLYFDSNRADPAGAMCLDETRGLRRALWVTRRVGGGWSAPARVAGAPAAAPFAWQAFATADDQELYWTGPGLGCPTICFHRAYRQLDGTFGDHELVAVIDDPSAAGPDDAIAIGELSLTADRQYLYFVFATPAFSDLGIAVARHR